MATTKSGDKNENHTPMLQRSGALEFAADGTPLEAAPTERAVSLEYRPAQVSANAAFVAARQMKHGVAPTSCQQCLTISMFFDGTGNNMQADLGTMQHSNVVRLFQSHLVDSEFLNRYSFYIPGLGTYFPDIGDPGNTTLGLGMGAMGQERLDWAFEKFNVALKDAEARAKNPTNKITGIKLSVFGFSRGATAARAFVRDMAKRCKVEKGVYRLKQGGYPIEVIFLGIFDTVASVGLPMSANNTPAATSLGWNTTRRAIDIRAKMSETNILAMAFGEPGADPAPGSYNGHASWADGLEVLAPDFVKRCVHMVAGHKIRNSFPSDSVLFGTHYPSGVVEMVYPGAHSDVGGGYQPGEGARSADPAEMLSLIPLRAMHAEARAAGVPLDSLEALKSDASVNRSFALDTEGAKKFDAMLASFNRYMRVAGSGGRDIGKELLAHSSWFLRWRFFSIRRSQRAGGVGPDQATIKRREPQFAAERKRIAARVLALKSQADEAQAILSHDSQQLQGELINQARLGTKVNPQTKANLDESASKNLAARDSYLREKARLDTYADDSALAANLAAYDQRLVEDGAAIVAHQLKNPKLKLRPHYRNLVDAYQAQYVRGDPLDADVVTFFDRYVHDSLAGFAGDATLPSDPRVVYAGGNNKIRFAGLAVPSESPVTAALPAETAESTDGVAA